MTARHVQFCMPVWRCRCGKAARARNGNHGPHPRTCVVCQKERTRALQRERQLRRRVGGEYWQVICAGCHVVFVVARAGRPRKWCQPCAAKRLDRQESA